MAEFTYNNKIHSAIKVLFFRVNCGQDPRMGFEGRKRGRYEAAGEFMERIKRIQEKAKVVLKKAQEEIKQYANRKRRERGILKRELSNTKYKEFEVVDKRKKDRKTNRTVCGPI